MFTVQSIHVAFEIWGCIFCLIAAFCIYNGRKTNLRSQKPLLAIELTVAFLLLSDALAWSFRGVEGTVGSIIVRISNFCVFFTSDLILFLFNEWVISYLFSKDETMPKRVMLIKIISCIGMLLVVFSQFTHIYYYFDAQNYYHRNTWYPISIVIPYTGMLIDLSLIIQYRKRLRKEIFMAMCSYIALPAVSAVILLFYYGIAFLNMAIAVSAGCMFVAVNLENNRTIIAQHEELTDMKIKIMLSQINPHFLYNSLTAIQQLCVEDPKLAEETVNEFAIYLRGNLNSLTSSPMIPFDKELEHVQTYLSIEKKRFGDAINVEWDLRATDFMIPPLTLQPLVENAVKHGIRQKEEGGTILIQTYSTQHHVVIHIKDDGAGFDVANTQLDENHVGLSNTKTRLKKICDGELKVTSKIQKGTDVTILLPVKGNAR